MIENDAKTSRIKSRMSKNADQLSSSKYSYQLTRGEKVLAVVVPSLAVLATLLALLTNFSVLDVTREMMLRYP